MRPLPEEKNYVEMAIKDGLYFALAAFERDVYEHPALENKHKSEIARILGLSRAGLAFRLDKLGIKIPPKDCYTKKAGKQELAK